MPSGKGKRPRTRGGRRPPPPHLPEDVERLVRTYHAWRGDRGAGAYKDVPGFCRAAPLDELRRKEHSLVPGHYVAPLSSFDEPIGEDFAERFAPIARELTEHLDRAAELEAKIRALIERLEP